MGPPIKDADSLYGNPRLRAAHREQRPANGALPKRFKALAIKAFLLDEISRGRLAELLDLNIADVEAEVTAIREELGETLGKSFRLTP